MVKISSKTMVLHPAIGDNASTTSFPLTAAWQRDSRDSATGTNKGRYQRANLELSAVGTLRYYRAVYQHQYFLPIRPQHDPGVEW